MTYETYHFIFVMAAVLAGVFLILSAILFVGLKIPGVVGDLSGATARKAIQSIREQNEQSGNKSSRINRERGKVTEKITSSGRLLHHSAGGFGAHTEKINIQMLQQQAGETEVLSTVPEEAALVNMGMDETTVLTQNIVTQPFFEIEQDITFIHTEELIT